MIGESNIIFRFDTAFVARKFHFIVLANAYCITDRFRHCNSYGAAPLPYYFTIVR